jgi:FlaA1/EpsC-like NDP-sugar epimerase
LKKPLVASMLKPDSNLSNGAPAQPPTPLPPSAAPGTWFAFLLRHRVWLLAFGHLIIFATAYLFAFGLRFDFQIPLHQSRQLWASLPTILLVKLTTFYMIGHFHGWWRYVTFADLVALMKASVFSLLVLVLINSFLFEGMIPRFVLTVDCLVTALVIGALRASWRLCREQNYFNKVERRYSIVIGADHRSGLMAHQIHSHPDLPYRVVGFLDENRAKHGTRLGGIPVLGKLDDLNSVASTLNATDVLVASDGLAGNDLRKLMDSCEANQLQLKIVPSLVNQFTDGQSLPIRDVEINDLLQRDPIELDMDKIAADVAGKTVMVTGAGGSIGSELCRQLLQFAPGTLILVERGENSLFLINNELARKSQGVDIKPIVADVLEEARMRTIFSEHRPDFVFHAAAHKHVGLMEGNSGECVRNNVLGTRCVADLAHEFKALKFVLISTDKAVNPTSVMGASKQIAERYIHTMAQHSETAFVVVRFGNVLGSNGSVVPLFQQQIRRGGPVTVTDERMTRFFMTIPEASQLVLQAAAMGSGGEIFVLEMGDQIYIVDLAKDLIRLSGLPTGTVKIDFVGIRPGEKLYEELYNDEEQMLETSHPKVRAAYHRPYSTESVLQSISDLSETLEQGDAVVRQMLKRIVPEYSYPMPASINQKNDQTADNDAGFEEATRLNEHKNGNLPVENGRIPFPK